jgi:hypothetical protein
VIGGFGQTRRVRPLARQRPPGPVQPSDVQTYVRSKSLGIDTSQLTVTTTWAAGSGCGASPYKGPGCVVTVTVSYRFKYMLVFVKTVTMSSTSKFAILL